MLTPKLKTIQTKNYYAFLPRKWQLLPRVIQTCTNLANFIGLYFPYLQHFSTKLCSFTNFNTAFQALVKDFVFFCLDQNLVHNGNCPLLALA